MPLCSVIAYISPSTAWSYVLYILQLDKMVWLRNEVAALIAVFICEESSNLNTEGNFNSSKPVQLERRDSIRGQGASSVMPIGASQDSCGRFTGWKGPWWGELRLLAGPRSPGSSLYPPAQQRAYCKQNQTRHWACKAPAPEPWLGKAPNVDVYAWNTVYCDSCFHAGKKKRCKL